MNYWFPKFFVCSCLLLFGLVLSNQYSLMAQPGPIKPGRIVTQYALTTGQDTHTADPASWKLLGSNDEGKSWVALDNQTNQIFARRGLRKVYSITNSQSFSTFRLEITAMRPIRTSTHLSEL